MRHPSAFIPAADFTPPRAGEQPFRDRAPYEHGLFLDEAGKTE
jgi:hypothetical protein